MPADKFLPEYDERRLVARPTPNLTGDEPGLSRVRSALQQRGPKGAAGAPLTQAGAPAPNTHIGPTVAYGTSVRSRAASPTTTTEGVTVMRRITRTIQHLIAGSLASQRVARANAAKASVTLEARREDREGVDAHLETHRVTLAQDATRAVSAETTTGGRAGGQPGGGAGPDSPGVENHQDAGQDHLHNDSQHNSQGSVMVPSPRDTPTTGTAAEVDPEPQAAAAAVVTETVASTSEGAR